MRKLLVRGGFPLQGNVMIQGAKNATQKILPATILWPGVYVIRNIALIEDAYALLSILRFLGAKIIFLSEHDVQINTEDIRPQEIPPEMTARSTGTFLFAGALLGRFGEAKLWHPGGDRIGKRPVTRHLEAFRRLGATIHETQTLYDIRATKLRGNTIWFEKPTANGAINAVIAAMRASGITTIENVAPEPEILCALHFFQTMGGSVQWIEPHVLQVQGKQSGTGVGEITVIPDRNDAATFLIAGILGHGPVTLRNVCLEHLKPLLDLLPLIGCTSESAGKPGSVSLTVQCDQLTTAHLHITSSPFPGFSTDWGPMAEVLLTQVPGSHVFHETIFARRFAHIPELVRMGATIQSIDLSVDTHLYHFDHDALAPFAHAIALSGPSQLHPAPVRANDVRAGAALVLAGLVAEGETEVTGIEQIERGYEAFPERLCQLGASVHLLEE